MGGIGKFLFVSATPFLLRVVSWGECGLVRLVGGSECIEGDADFSLPNWLLFTPDAPFDSNGSRCKIDRRKGAAKIY